jgi:hypothetical protein
MDLAISHMNSKIIRDNLRGDNYASFKTSFNSSSIYVKALETGEALLSISLAIEYPSAYKSK